MRICIDASPALDRRAGIGRYAQELAAALRQLGEDLVGFSNLLPPGTPDPPFDQLPILTSNMRNKPWRLAVLMAHILRRRQDHLFPGVTVFHGTDHLLPRLSGITGVLTVHDFTCWLYPRTHTIPNRVFLAVAMRYFLRAADAVIADSECTKRDAVRLYGAALSRMRVIHLGVADRFQPVSASQKQALREKYNLPDHFLLALGRLEPRKNLGTIVDAFARLKRERFKHKLVIAGREGWLSEGFRGRVRKLGLGPDVILTGYVPDADLPMLYGSADLFIFGSLYEGFGLPILEAMACGTPVACSNTSSMPEVAGDAALFFDPRKSSDIAEKVAHALENPRLLGELRERGLARAKTFTWKKTAEETLGVYREAGA